MSGCLTQVEHVSSNQISIEIHDVVISVELISLVLGLASSPQKILRFPSICRHNVLLKSGVSQ